MSLHQALVTVCPTREEIKEKVPYDQSLVAYGSYAAALLLTSHSSATIAKSICLLSAQQFNAASIEYLDVARLSYLAMVGIADAREQEGNLVFVALSRRTSVLLDLLRRRSVSQHSVVQHCISYLKYCDGFRVSQGCVHADEGETDLK